MFYTEEEVRKRWRRFLYGLVGISSAMSMTDEEIDNIRNKLKTTIKKSNEEK